MRPCGCERDAIVFGHSHPGEPVAFITRVIWQIVPAATRGATR